MRLVITERETGAATVALVSPQNSQRVPPPPVRGQRVSRALSSRAVRVLSDACDMAPRVGRPLRAFWTFTVAPEYRPQMLDGSLTLGAQVSRFLKAFRKRYPDEVYVWVCESPLNSDGAPNPHVHFVTSLVVSRAEFQAFAAWVESVWSFGYVHCERLRYPDRAGRYLLKAIGYIGKGAKADQGEVFGRRYDVSACLRPEVKRIELQLDAQSFKSVCELFGGGARSFGSGFFTGRGMVYDAGNEGCAVRDMERLAAYGTGVVIEATDCDESGIARSVRML